MSLVEADLATALILSSGLKDKDGNDPISTSMTNAYAEGMITAIKASKAAHASGTIQGSGPFGSPLEDGEASNGTIVGLLYAPLFSKCGPAFAAEGATVSEVEAENQAIINYLLANIKIKFDPNDITGTVGPPPAAPILVGGAGDNGYIYNINGAAAAAFVSSATGITGVFTETHYTALCDYIKDNTVVKYLSGSVTGSFPSGGGTMSAGTGVDGSFS